MSHPYKGYSEKKMYSVKIFSETKLENGMLHTCFESETPLNLAGKENVSAVLSQAYTMSH